MLKTFLVVLALLLFSSVPANSREITEGTTTVTTPFGFVNMFINASGTDFRVSVAGSGLFGISGFAPCTTSNLCSPGQAFNLSARSGQWEFTDVSGTMTIDGTQFFFVNAVNTSLPFLSGRGSMNFTGGSVMIPFSDAPIITLKAPFAMGGSLSGRATGTSGVSLSLTGSGIASLVLSELIFNGSEFYRLQSLIYRFGPQVDVDIEPSHINLRSRGKVPVAILSTADFDASAIDLDTVTVAGAPIDLRPNGTLASSLHDINGDGLLDLVVHISTAELQLTNFNTEALVEGFTLDRKFFWGSDAIEVVE